MEYVVIGVCWLIVGVIVGVAIAKLHSSDEGE